MNKRLLPTNKFIYTNRIMIRAFFVVFFYCSQYALPGNNPVKSLGGRFQNIVDHLKEKNSFVDQGKVEHLLAELKATIRKLDIYKSDAKTKKKSDAQILADNEYKKFKSEFERINAAYKNLAKKKDKKEQPVKNTNTTPKKPEEKPIVKTTPQKPAVVKNEDIVTQKPVANNTQIAKVPQQRTDSYEAYMMNSDDIKELVKQQVDDALGENKAKDSSKTNPWIIGLFLVFALFAAILAVVWVVFRGKGVDMFANIPFLKSANGHLTSPHSAISGQNEKELQKALLQLESSIQENSAQIRELSLAVKELKGREHQVDKKVISLEQKLSSVIKSADESAEYIDFLKRKIEGKRAAVKEENSGGIAQSADDTQGELNGDLNSLYNSASGREYQQEFRNKMLVCSMANSREILEEHQDLDPLFIEDNQGTFLISEEKGLVFVNFNIPSARRSLIEIAFQINGMPGDGMQKSKFPAKVKKTIFGWELVERGYIDFNV